MALGQTKVGIGNFSKLFFSNYDEAQCYFLRKIKGEKNEEIGESRSRSAGGGALMGYNTDISVCVCDLV